MSEADETATTTGMEHLQAAARELIAAFRSVLDVAEELVEDPATVKEAVTVFGDVARQAARQAANFAAGAAKPNGTNPAANPSGASDPAGVEHIDLD